METTIAWHGGTKSYMDMTYRNNVGDRVFTPHHGFWIEAPIGEKLYEPLAGLLFLRAIALLGSSDLTHSIHFAKGDDSRLTPETPYNEPFRFVNGEWCKAKSNEEMLQRVAGYGLLALSMIQNGKNKES